jgi:hypothetical protein
MAQIQVKVPYTENYDYGVGVDLATGSPMGKVVVGEPSGVAGAGGATASFDISRIHSTSDLESKLGIHVEASGGCGCFGASARFDFAKTSKIQTSSLFMAITSTIVLENLSIEDPALSPLAAQIVDRADVFSTRYGNMFVRGMGRGGLFVGVMQIDTTSSEDSESLSAELGGSYGMFSAKAKTNFEEVQKKYHSEIHINVYHEGGPIGLSMNDIGDANQLYIMLQRWLQSFQDNPKENARPYSVTLAPIAIANGPIPPNAVDIQHAQDILMLCARQRSVILDGLNLMDFIFQNSSRYDFVAPTTPADIAKASNGYQADFDLVAAAASQAINNITKAVTPADYAKQIGQPYPQGVPPTPMPTLKKGLPQPKTVPNFTGLTWGAARELSQQTGVRIDEFQPSGPDDHATDSLQMLVCGVTNQDGIVLYHPHSDDQIMVTWQEQPSGSMLLPGATVYLAIGLAPGVPE